MTLQMNLTRRKITAIIWVPQRILPFFAFICEHCLYSQFGCEPWVLHPLFLSVPMNKSIDRLWTLLYAWRSSNTWISTSHCSFAWLHYTMISGMLPIHFLDTSLMIDGIGLMLLTSIWYLLVRLVLANRSAFCGYNMVIRSMTHF